MNNLFINNAKLLCVHNFDLSDFILVNLYDDNIVYPEVTQVDGINQDCEDGLYQFVKSDEIVLKDYNYIDRSTSIRYGN